MIHFSSKYRSTQPEIMDEFDLKGEEMKKVLTDLKSVNKWLGGNNVTLDGIKELLPQSPSNKAITVIMDVGCGDGEMLRACARYAKKNNYYFKLIGLDANSFILEEAKQRSKNFSNIEYHTLDVFSEETMYPEVDIILCTLFLHHFSTEKIIDYLKKIVPETNYGVVVNDLHRSWLAFQLFRLVSKFILKTKTARYDGLVSVARGFKKKELIEISEKIKSKNYSLKWKWAFRYQLIFKNK